MSQEETNIEAVARELVDRKMTLQIATRDDSGLPQISYSPFLFEEEHFYLFISELASHTQHLMQFPKAQIMILEDERDSPNLFARKRLIIDIEATFIEREDHTWTALMDKFEARQGKTVPLLKSLSDFWLVKLSPQQGRWVQGFGQAFTFEGLDLALATQLTGK